MIAGLVLALAATSTQAPAREVWAGHAVVIGRRSVPFLGKVEARTSSMVLAEVTRSGRSLSLVQRSCRIDLENPTGVELSLVPGAAERLPPVRLDFEQRRDGRWYQGPDTTGWTRADADGDGQPGMTVLVDAPICGGKLFVGVRTTNRSRGVLEAHGMRGELRARVQQHVIDTEGACLGVLAPNTDESVEGRFAYVRVDANATCASLAGEWPVRAE